MMRAIDLLPSEYAERRAQRRNLMVAVGAGAMVLVLLIVWYLSISGQVGAAENDLADVQRRNTVIESEIGELQRFADLQSEVQSKEAALQTVMAGDVAWPSIMTEVAMVIPGEVWLTTLTTSAGATEGASPVGTETATIRVSEKSPFGRIQFTGNSLTMEGVAKWMVRLGGAKTFSAVWLNSATETDVEGVTVFNFDSTLELNNRAASHRFENGATP